jgi:hypothetical protein
VIVVDINLLLYAHNAATPLHEPARRWWETTLNGEQLVGLPWVSVLGFVRLVTHPRILVTPLSPLHALERVEEWFELDTVRVLEPGPRHLAILRRLFAATGVGGELTTDTHLAAIAIEHQCELCSNDSDFSRFPGLRWVNPLAAA